ncbi:multiple sugar transport system substrate-binding protein [Bradyrhizobium sp. CIR48]|uniref:ABC transporter substrate-binding protein n=1 Tax=Bradyrhizobium sp. CIR48 TaxID=2663840 RepID=UPI001606625C|nr:extracellular solute-binding protein [Bradyrhizobium sp. CIR48]MBB4424192.1 multiple sugar transport system substrate-binding protein [Bradyrhizobium sp. CIR48]
MRNDITRRDALALGLSAATLAATGAAAQTTSSTIKAADVAAPKLDIEKGASLRMLRPVRFVQADEDVFRANAAKFTKETGVEVKVDFVGWEDINQQTAVTSNSGAGPDIIMGFSDAPHIYIDKLIELTDVADYVGKRYGGWLPLAQRYGKKNKSNDWIGLPFGATAGPLIYRKSILQSVGFDKVPEDHAGVLDLCQKLHKAGKPAGFALGNARGDGTGFANWALWSHNASLLDEDGNVTINSKETIAALNWVKQLYPTFIAGTTSWNDVSNNRAYSAQEISLTANGVSLYFSLKNDPATKAIADDCEHQLLPKGLAKVSPMDGLTLNAMVFKHSQYPNAAKAFLQYMLEKDQYEPWLNANSGYWSQPLAAYADAAVWSQDPKVSIFKNTMNSTYYSGYKGPISTASGAVTADYVLIQMLSAVATGAATPEAAAAEAEQRCKRYFRRQR